MSANAERVELTERPDGVELSVKVVPGSSRTGIAGVWDTALRLAVAAPPEGGQANKQVARLLAETFGTRRGQVTIIRGQTQPLKRVCIVGISGEHARQVLRSVLEKQT